jgi:hypothetical protein
MFPRAAASQTRCGLAGPDSLISFDEIPNTFDQPPPTRPHGLRVQIWWQHGAANRIDGLPFVSPVVKRRRTPRAANSGVGRQSWPGLESFRNKHGSCDHGVSTPTFDDIFLGAEKAALSSCSTLPIAWRQSNDPTALDPLMRARQVYKVPKPVSLTRSSFGQTGIWDPNPNPHTLFQHRIHCAVKPTSLNTDNNMASPQLPQTPRGNHIRRGLRGRG